MNNHRIKAPNVPEENPRIQVCASKTRVTVFRVSNAFHQKNACKSNQYIHDGIHQCTKKIRHISVTLVIQIEQNSIFVLKGVVIEHDTEKKSSFIW